MRLLVLFLAISTCACYSELEMAVSQSDKPVLIERVQEASGKCTTSATYDPWAQKSTQTQIYVCGGGWLYRVTKQEPK